MTSFHASNEALDPVCDTAKDLKKALGDQILRALHLKQLRATDLVRAGMKSVRASDISMLYDGAYEKFGINRLLRLAEMTGSHVRIEVESPFSLCRGLASSNADLALSALMTAGDAARHAKEAISIRSYPAAHTAASMLSSACSRVAETLRASGRTGERSASQIADVIDAMISPLEDLKSSDRVVTKAASDAVKAAEAAIEALHALASTAA